MNEDCLHLDIVKDILKAFKWHLLQLSTLINISKNIIIQKLPEITAVIEREISNKVNGASGKLLFSR